MVKKLVYCFESRTSTGIDNDDDGESKDSDRERPRPKDRERPSAHLYQSFMLNDHVHHFLKKRKNCIGEHYKSKKWDKYKKLANDYELIYTSSSGCFPSITSYPAISRSFFKMWEIVTDFEDILHLKTRPSLKAAFLAEGPGGFMEAFARYRPYSLLKTDALYGITLISPDKNIPNWRIPCDIMSTGNVRLLRGIDNTGSLYNVNNIDSYVRDIGRANADLVTSDGGFDFSNNFNSQEELSMYLIVCEVYTALRLQAQGGTFILKIYDMHTVNTMRILSVLVKYYEKLHIIKPISSRPANSEKYLLCTGLKCAIDEKSRDMDTFRRVIKTRDCMALHALHLDPIVVHQTVNYNIFYISRQVFHIQKTLCLIKTLKIDRKDPDFIATIRGQLAKSIRWCHKYKLSLSRPALHYYKSLLDGGSANDA